MEAFSRASCAYRSPFARAWVVSNSQIHAAAAESLIGGDKYGDSEKLEFAFARGERCYKPMSEYKGSIAEDSRLAQGSLRASGMLHRRYLCQALRTTVMQPSNSILGVHHE